MLLKMAKRQNENQLPHSDAILLTDRQDSGIIETIKKTGIKGKLHIPPVQIDTSQLTIDWNHIDERNHDVTLKEAMSFIETADISISKWNGQFENYYSVSGAAFINLKTNEIRTAFKADEYDDYVKKMMEVLEEWKKK